MREHGSSMRQEPRLGAETEVVETGRAKEARLPLPTGGGLPPKARPGLPLLFTHLCLFLTTAQPSGQGASQATFDQRPGYPLDMAFSPHRRV